jgi:uncharacterized protein
VKILIEKIGEEGLDIDEALPREWLVELLGTDAVYQPATDGHIKVHLSRVDDAVHVHGHAKLDMVSPCSRCLTPVNVAMQPPLKLTLVPREDEPKAKSDGEVVAEDLGIATYEDEEIDLGRIVHDEVILELPMVSLCSENCAGLCASCGQNLNEGPCTCAPAVDMRWSALQRIKIN